MTELATTNGTTTAPVSASKSMSEMAEMIAKLTAENAQLKASSAASAPKVYLKVSPKGGVSLYGMGRWPVTLYQEQWDVVEEMLPQVKTFIAAHKAELSLKGDPKRDVADTAPAASNVPNGASAASAADHKNGAATTIPPVAGGAPTIADLMTPEQRKMMEALGFKF